MNQTTTSPAMPIGHLVAQIDVPYTFSSLDLRDGLANLGLLDPADDLLPPDDLDAVIAAFMTKIHGLQVHGQGRAWFISPAARSDVALLQRALVAIRPLRHQPLPLLMTPVYPPSYGSTDATHEDAIVGLVDLARRHIDDAFAAFRASLEAAGVDSEGYHALNKRLVTISALVHNFTHLFGPLVQRSFDNTLQKFERGLIALRDLQRTNA